MFSRKLLKNDLGFFAQYKKLLKVSVATIIALFALFVVPTLSFENRCTYKNGAEVWAQQFTCPDNWYFGGSPLIATTTEWKISDQSTWELYLDPTGCSGLEAELTFHIGGTCFTAPRLFRILLEVPMLNGASSLLDR